MISFDKVSNILLAGVLADAWGNPYEGLAFGSNRPLRAHSRISDDSQLILATCQAIVKSNGKIEPECIAQSFRSWFEANKLHGVGSATLKALRDLSAGAHWALSGASGEFSAGNGAAMRIAPLAFFLDVSDYFDRKIIRDVVRITHKHDEAYAGAVAVLVALHTNLGLIQGGLLDNLLEFTPDSLVRDRIAELWHQHPDVDSLDIPLCTSGYVAQSVPFAIYIASLFESRSVSKLVNQIVSFGGDCDTIGSIAAQIAVAKSAETVDSSLLSSIDDIQEILAIIHQFSSLGDKT